jgi:alcohol dehydrogenase
MLPSYYEFFNPVKIASGKKALDNLPYELNQLDVQRPLIITDKGVVEAVLVRIVTSSFADSGITLGGGFMMTCPPTHPAKPLRRLPRFTFRTNAIV